jgi:hypothetical protein
METITKDGEEEVVFLSLRINKKYMRLMRIVFTVTAVAGVLLFYIRHS